MPKNFFQVLNIIWLAISGAPLMLMVIFVLITIEPAAPELKNTFEYIALMIAFSLLFTANFIYKIQVNKAQNISLNEKLKLYQQANIVKAALLESAAVICIIAYFFTKTFWVLGVPIAVIIWIWLNRPSKTKFCEEFEASESDLADYL